MLVIVYLVHAKEQVIIPQEWIMNLDQERLNNSGKNSTQDRRIYWSNSITTNDNLNDASVIVPNFHLPESKVFPPNTDEACYIARINRFCASEKKAKDFCDYFRSRMPVVYNPVLPFQPPIPRTSPPLTPAEASTIDTESLESTIETENDELDIEAESIPVEYAGNQIEEFDTKPERPVIILPESDLLALGQMFGNEYDEDEDPPLPEASAEISDLVLQPNETSFYEDGAIKVTRTYSDGFEMTYTYGEAAVPKPPQRFVVKKNDIISKNLPFDDNDEINGQRVYLLQIGESFKEVGMAAEVVNILLMLNNEENRGVVFKDKLFIKALLVGLIGLDNIKAKKVDKHIVRFIKELFSYRVEEFDDYNLRYTNFSKTYDMALTEIQNNLYYTKN